MAEWQLQMILSIPVRTGLFRFFMTILIGCSQILATKRHPRIADCLVGWVGSWRDLQQLGRERMERLPRSKGQSLIVINNLA
jgi:hypothetical protein